MIMANPEHPYPPEISHFAPAKLSSKETGSSLRVPSWLSGVSTRCKSEVSSVENPGWLGYIGDEISYPVI